jgi:DUF2075 family protein/SOS-response transcriptional repressor LexA
MDRVIEPTDIPSDCTVAIEMQVPQSSKRMDFVLTGYGPDRRKTAVIVELKQWESARRTTKDGIVETFLAGTMRETSHPSYQAWSYAALLEDFNVAVREAPVVLAPCAYLHNCAGGADLRHAFYGEHLRRAPVFLRDDAARLRDFIRDHVRHGDAGAVLYEIDNGRIRPSKNLADQLGSLMDGKPEFILIDDQKLVFETALALSERAAEGPKQTLIVEGGPGTGKSVVAINLLVSLIRRARNVQYVTRNAAPRAVYEAKLAGHMRRSRISNLFKGSGSYHACAPDAFDALIVDEAHRLNEKGGLYGNVGENQIMELIRSSRLSVFFVDDAQRVTLKDIGGVQTIRDWAEKLGSAVTVLPLASQFRCGGSDGYLGWVDHTLGIRDTANRTLQGVGYEVKICDSATELRHLVRERNQPERGVRARMVAGYCWPWRSKKSAAAMDITIPEEGFSAQWNLSDDGSLWILKDSTVEEVGCIHTCQGLELDYIGVIIGPDLVWRGDRWVEFPNRRDRHDKTIKGYKRLQLSDPLAAERAAREIIRNTYRTLMTRGTRGCFLFSVDPETNRYLKDLVAEKAMLTAVVGTRAELGEILPFATIEPAERRKYVNCVPCFPSLRVAAGEFQRDEFSDDVRWVELPDVYKVQIGQFIVRVTGESMNQRIPSGSWCLFRRAPEGTREGRIVLVQHREIQDPEGGSLTVKRYQSEKRRTDAGDWQHIRITLSPMSTDSSFRPIVLGADAEIELKVMGEFVAVLEV